jgi:hypothetical protein
MKVMWGLGRRAPKATRSPKCSSWMLGLLVTALGAGCGNAEPKEADHAASTTAAVSDDSDKPEGTRTAKPSAPVAIHWKVGAANATIDVGFMVDASDVTIDVWGVDGLTVTSTGITRAGQAVASTQFSKGEHVDVNVSFTAPTTVRTNLAVRVRGNFGGSVRERVQSFTVNGDLPAATKAPGEVKVGPDGTPVRVMKAE